MKVLRIAGGAMTPFNRRKDGSSWRDWCLAAFDEALRDAALEVADVDALVVASESDFFSLQLNPAAMIADALGLHGIRVQRVEGGGATGYLAVQAGAALQGMQGVDQDRRSRISAMPWPPPTHMVIRPVVLSCQSRLLSMVFCRRAPVMPKG